MRSHGACLCAWPLCVCTSAQLREVGQQLGHCIDHPVSVQHKARPGPLQWPSMHDLKTGSAHSLSLVQNAMEREMVNPINLIKGGQVYYTVRCEKIVVQMCTWSGLLARSRTDCRTPNVCDGKSYRYHHATNKKLVKEKRLKWFWLNAWETI